MAATQKAVVGQPQTVTEGEKDREFFMAESGYISHSGNYVTGVTVNGSETFDRKESHIGTTVMWFDELNPNVQDGDKHLVIKPSVNDLMANL